MQYTTNYNLKKPEDNDVTSNEDFNENFDAVDEEMKRVADETKGKLSKEEFDSHNHKSSDITDFPTALPADGGDADTVGGIGKDGFVRNYKQLPNGTSILAWAESVANVHNIVTARIQNPPDPPTNYGYIAGDCDFWVTAHSLSTNKDYIQLEIRDIRSNSVFRNNKLGGVWRGWDSTNDGGNAYTVGGKTEAQLIKYDDLFAYTDGRIISSVLWINIDEFDDAMRKTYGIIPGTPDSPPGLSYGIRLPCIAYDKNGVLVTVVQLDPYENQGKVWTNVYRKHLGSWTGWRANNDGGNASTLGGLASHDFVRYSGNSVLARKQGTSKEGGEIVFEKADDSTLKGNPFLDLFNNTIRFVTPSSRGGTAVIELLIDEPLKANNTIAVFTAGTTDITPGVTNLGKNQIYIMYE